MSQQTRRNGDEIIIDLQKPLYLTISSVLLLIDQSIAQKKLYKKVVLDVSHSKKRDKIGSLIQTRHLPGLQLGNFASEGSLLIKWKSDNKSKTK